MAAFDIEKANLISSIHSSTQSLHRVHSTYILLKVYPYLLQKFTIAESDVYDALTSLNPTKAMGIDGIGPKILKSCALALYQPIHHLFVLSLTQHYLPKEWRLHLITPIFKSGNKSSVKN